MGKVVTMRTRRQYEDIIHDLICRILPKFPPQDIRPAYQSNRDYASKNSISLDPADDGITGYSNEDNFMYFVVKFDPLTSMPYIDEEGNANVTRVIDVTCSVYGESSANVALLINTLVLGPDAQSFLQQYGLHTYNEMGWSINQINEEINGEYWERHDVSFKLSESIDLVVPYYPVVAKETEVTFVVDGRVKDAKSILSE